MDQSVSFLGVCIFYDRRELFCLRILSFRSVSRWVRAHFLGKPQKGLPEKMRTRISMGFATSKTHKRETQGKYFYLVFIILEICCFRHLEKPIKTKENKVKHFGYCCLVFICFYWFSPVFLEGESN